MKRFDFIHSPCIQTAQCQQVLIYKFQDPAHCNPERHDHKHNSIQRGVMSVPALKPRRKFEELSQDNEVLKHILIAGGVGRDLIEKALREVRHGGEVDAVTREYSEPQRVARYDASRPVPARVVISFTTPVVAISGCLAMSFSRVTTKGIAQR
jgi:hypothetical protein